MMKKLSRNKKVDLILGTVNNIEKHNSYYIVSYINEDIIIIPNVMVLEDWEL